MTDEIDLRNNVPEKKIGRINELSEAEKAQIKMTYWVLGGIAILFALSGAAYILTDNGVSAYLTDIQSICAVNIQPHEHITAFCNKYISEAKSETNSAAKEIFEFCKTFLPPVVTLVLGAHYVSKAGE